MKRVVLVVALAFAAREAPAALIMFGGVGNGSAVSPGGLLEIDQNNGTGTLIGTPVGNGGLSGIAFDTSGTLFGSTANSGSPSDLVTIDPLTGNQLSSIGLGISFGDLAVQPGTDTIFGIRSNSDGFSLGGELYTISSTGVTTFIGDTGVERGGGLAFKPDGTLYFLEFSALHTLDPLTGSILNTISIGIAGDGLAVRPNDGVLFASQVQMSDRIFTVDPSNGTATTIGFTGAGAVSDLAFFDFNAMPPPMPEPRTLLLFGAGLIALWRTRRHV